MRVWNAQLTVEPRQIIVLPYGAELLKIIVKSGLPHLYFSVYEEEDRASIQPEARVFRTVCAGEKYDLRDNGKYVDSFVLNEWFIGHVFEDDNGVVEDRYHEDFRAINQELRGE